MFWLVGGKKRMAQSVMQALIGLFIVFIVGIQIFSGTLIANNALLNLSWTVGVPVGVLILILSMTGLVRF